MFDCCHCVYLKIIFSFPQITDDTDPLIYLAAKVAVGKRIKKLHAAISVADVSKFDTWGPIIIGVLLYEERDKIITELST